MRNGKKVFEHYCVVHEQDKREIFNFLFPCKILLENLIYSVMNVVACKWSNDHQGCHRNIIYYTSCVTTTAKDANVVTYSQGNVRP